MKGNNKWTYVEVEKLKQVYPTAPLRTVLETFSRHSVKSIWQKANDLGIHRGVARRNNPFYGKSHNKRTKRKIAEANKGKKPWNYGIPMSEEQKLKLSISKQGIGLGRIPWNKGIPTTAEAKSKISLANLGRKHTSDELSRMRRCTLNENAFNVITEEAAYWIGFLLADGNVGYRKNKKGREGFYIISLALQAKDLNHLLKFQIFLDSSHRINCRVNSKRNTYSYSLKFSSERIAQMLERYGVVSRKSLTAKVKLLEENKHLWRGIIDGDGTISIDSFGRPWIKMVGSFEIVSQFKAFLEKESCVKMPQIYRIGSIYRIVISCNTCIKVLKLLYENSSTALERKWIRAQKIIQIGYKPGILLALRNEMPKEGAFERPR